MTAGTAYALTGNREKELESHVGHRVEIVGSLEGRGASSTGSSGYGTGTSTGTASGTGTGSGTASGTGTTSGTGSTGTGTTSSGTSTGTASGSGTMSGGTQRFGDLQQINVTSFRMISGSCTP